MSQFQAALKTLSVAVKGYAMDKSRSFMPTWNYCLSVGVPRSLMEECVKDALKGTELGAKMEAFSIKLSSSDVSDFSYITRKEFGSSIVQDGF